MKDPQKEEILAILKDWKELKCQLENLHRERNQENILEGMNKGIEIFLKFIFWSNEKPVPLNMPLSFHELDYKPVNLQERLAFIISRPKVFHSFIQLSELMIEQEKQYSKRSIMKKTSRP